MSGIIGAKLGMTQVYDDEGRVVPVTVIEAGPCVVTQKKMTTRDRYEAVQLGFGDAKEKRVTKPRIGHLKASGGKLFRILKEFRGDWDVALGDTVKCDIFAPGQKVDVTGTSKGKPFHDHRH